MKHTLLSIIICLMVFTGTINAQPGNVFATDFGRTVLRAETALAARIVLGFPDNTAQSGLFLRDDMTWASAGGGYTNLTEFVDQTAWRVFYSDGSGDVTELALGADGTFLKSNGASSAPTFSTPAGSGDVSKVGTPVNDQVGIWTGDGTLEGDADLTFDGTNLSVTGSFSLGTLLDITPTATQSHSEGRIYYDSDTDTFKAFNAESDIALDIGEELWIYVRNNSGATISDSNAVYITGTIGQVPTIALAQADDIATAKSIGIATHDIENNTNGYVTVSGVIHGIDTSEFLDGDVLYLSDSEAGDFTTTAPNGSSVIVEIGHVTYSHAVDGAILLHLDIDQRAIDVPIADSGSIITATEVEGALQENRTAIDLTESVATQAFNGKFLESFDFTIAEAGGTVTGSLEQTGTGDLTEWFSDGATAYDTSPADTIDLTAYVGSATVPVAVYVYILQSGKGTLVGTNAGWPATEHIKVANLVLQTAALTGTSGAIGNRNWNDHTKGTNNQGHISHISERIRQMNAQYNSGISMTLKNAAGAALTTTNSSTAVEIVTTEGTVYQMHKQTFPATDMYVTATDDVQIVNQVTDEGGAYATSIDLVTDITVFDDGTASGTAFTVNRYFNIVVWGIANKTGETSHIMVNIPTGQYTAESSAIADTSGFSVYTIPDAYRGIGFLIGRLTFRLIAGSEWTYIALDDLRGQFPATSAGVGVTTSSHDLLANLDYASAGHTGFVGSAEFTQARTFLKGTGSGTFTEQLDRVFDVRDYGTNTTPGTTDTTAFIQAAIDAAEAAGGGVVQLQGEEYLIATTVLTIDSANVTLQGVGAVSKITQSTSNVGNVSVTASNVTLRNFAVEGPQYAATQSLEVGISCAGADSNSFISQIKIQNITANSFGGAGIETQFCEHFEISGCYVTNCFKFGILDLSGRFGTITNCIVDGVIRDEILDDSYGIATTKGTGTEAAQPVSHDIQVTNCIIRNVNYWHGLSTHGGYNLLFSDNTIQNCRDGITLTRYNATGGEEASPNNCIVANNIIHNTHGGGDIPTTTDQRWGVAIIGDSGSSTQAQNNLIIGNDISGFGDNDGTIRANPTASITASVVNELLIIGNTIRTSGRNGMSFTDSDNITINGNQIVTISGDAAVAATGTITFADNPSNSDTITINGVEYTFVDPTAPATDYEIDIKASLALTLDEVLVVLNGATGPISGLQTDRRVSIATYTEDGTILTVTYDDIGTPGNTFSIAASSDTPSGAKLTGGIIGSSAIHIDGSEEVVISNNVIDVAAHVNITIAGTITVKPILANNTVLGTGPELDAAWTSTTDPRALVGTQYDKEFNLEYDFDQWRVATGDLLIGSGVDKVKPLPVGTNGYVLTVAAGMPSWVAQSGGGDMSKSTYDVAENSLVDGDNTAYNATSWNGNPDAASKDAIRDKIETLGGSGDLLADGTIPLTANWDVGAFTITGTQFISDIAGGTAPFVVTSSTEVANLKAATSGNSDTVTNATLTTALTVDTGTVGLTGNVANSSVLTLGAGASSVSGANTGDNTGAAGDTYTGVHNFGGATSIEIVNSTDPDVDAAGEISQDTDGANEAGDVSIRAYDGANQFLVDRKLKTIQGTVMNPQDLADAQRDQTALWHNNTGMVFTIVEIWAWSDVDNTSVNLEVVTATDWSTPGTIDALEIATDGTSVFYVTETTITDPTIAHDEIIVADFDDTDDPGFVKFNIIGWFNSDID